MALASASSNGIGECLVNNGGASTAAAVMSSSGVPWLIVSVFVAFRKAVVVLLAACMLLSRLAELRSLCSHSPVVDVPDLPLWLSLEITSATGLEHLPIYFMLSLSHSMRHVSFACL